MLCSYSVNKAINFFVCKWLMHRLVWVSHRCKLIKNDKKGIPLFDWRRRFLRRRELARQLAAIGNLNFVLIF